MKSERSGARAQHGSQARGPPPVCTFQDGSPLIVIGVPLTMNAEAFKTADGNLEASLRLICDAVHAQEVQAFTAS